MTEPTRDSEIATELRAVKVARHEDATNLIILIGIRNPTRSADDTINIRCAAEGFAVKLTAIRGDILDNNGVNAAAIRSRLVEMPHTRIV